MKSSGSVEKAIVHILFSGQLRVAQGDRGVFRTGSSRRHRYHWVKEDMKNISKKTKCYYMVFRCRLVAIIKCRMTYFNLHLMAR